MVAVEMTEEIDAIIFDAGGTLIDVWPPKEEIFARVLLDHDIGAKPERIALAMAKADRLLDAEFAAVQSRNESGFWQQYDDLVLGELGIKGRTKELSSDISDKFEAIMQKVESWTDYPDVRPALDRLRKRDLKIGVVSNATDLLNRVLHNLDLTKYFDFVVISDSVGVRKPSPKIFLIAAEEAGTNPSRSIYFGDKPAVDIDGAAGAGMKGVLVDRSNAFPDAECLRIKDLTYLSRIC